MPRNGSRAVQIDIPGTEAPAAATTARITRRYGLSRAHRDFLTSNVLPGYVEQMNEDIAVFEKMVADGGPLPVAGAMRMASQFRRQLDQAQTIADILENGVLNGGDDDSE